MITLNIDEHNNLITGKDLLIKSDSEALVQDIRTRLSLFVNEYPFNVNEGLDYVYLLSKNDKKEIENVIINEIKKDKRVSEVLINSVDFENSRLTLNIQVIDLQGGVLNV